MSAITSVMMRSILKLMRHKQRDRDYLSSRFPANENVHEWSIVQMIENKNGYPSGNGLNHRPMIQMPMFHRVEITTVTP